LVHGFRDFICDHLALLTCGSIVHHGWDTWKKNTVHLRKKKEEGEDGGPYTLFKDICH
jgi:hypothetical protein